MRRTRLLLLVLTMPMVGAVLKCATAPHHEVDEMRATVESTDTIVLIESSVVFKLVRVNEELVIENGKLLTALRNCVERRTITPEPL